jgi:hypothetical protein
MGKMRDAYKILIYKPEQNIELIGVELYGRIILKLI